MLNLRAGATPCSKPYCCSAGLLSKGRGGLLVFLERGAEAAVPHGSGVLDRDITLSGLVASSDSLRPIPNSFRVARRLGLIGGSGGGPSMPFFSEAPAGRSIVSTRDVEDRRATGSEISCLLTVFFRRGTWRVEPDGIGGGVGELADGVFGPETGGVGACMYGEPREIPPLAAKLLAAMAAGDGPSGGRPPFPLWSA